MAVTPMDLQVLFMQEGRAAKETDKQKNFAREKRARTARRLKAQDLRENVDSVNTAESKTVDEEGSQGSASYFARRQQQEPEMEEEDLEEKVAEEEGLGNMMDLKI